MKKYLWKKKKDKRRIHTLMQNYWREDMESFPQYPHDCYIRKFKSHKTKTRTLFGMEFKTLNYPGNIYWYVIGPPTYPDRPKLKRNRLYPRDYKWWNCCPKQWNKMYHTRPDRREWTKFERLVSVTYYASDWFLNGDPLHISERIPYPTNRRHVYFY